MANCRRKLFCYWLQPHSVVKLTHADDRCVFMMQRRHFLTSAATIALAATPLAGCATSSGTAPPLPAFPRAPRTPAIPQRAISRIALTSCSNPSKDLSFFGQVEARNSDLLLMMGDNVYGSYTPKDPNLPSLSEAYAKLAEVPAFKSLVSKVPTQAVWDDHDYGINDGGGDFAYKAQAQTMFNQFWNVPTNSPLRQRPGIYRAFQAGPKGQVLQVIMLDTRYFRAPLLLTDQRDVPGKERYVPHPPGSGADVLGEAQWAFLKAELEKPADVRLIVSSIQVVADGHGYERWGNFPDAQKRLYDLIAQTGAKGVVFASGDRHYGSINQVRDGVAYPLTDITASAINMPFRVAEGTTSYNEPATTRIGDGYAAINFGLIEINWAAGTLSLNLIGDGGKLAGSTTLDLKNLRRG